MAYKKRNVDFDCAAGRLEGCYGVNKYGGTSNCDAGVITDIWDGANDPTLDQPIWIPPTQARIHQITSTSALDTALGSGLRTMRVYGLPAWNLQEVSELITMNGVTNVPTVNAYVIIHRMKLISAGTTPNVGTISATADTDATVTAQIAPLKGQTKMALYGVCSGYTAYVTQYYFSSAKDSAARAVATDLRVNPDPENMDVFVSKHDMGIITSGTSYFTHEFKPYMRVSGPFIMKCQGTSTVNNMDVSAGFDLIIEED